MDKVIEKRLDWTLQAKIYQQREPQIVFLKGNFIASMDIINYIIYLNHFLSMFFS
jgi:hypothetical protein